VESHEGDHEDADGGELEGQESVGDHRDPDQHDEADPDRHQRRNREAEDPGAHTRVTAARPIRPAGRISRTATITTRANGIRRFWPAGREGPTSRSRTPTSSPPSTAPSGLSMPPSTAAAKANRRIGCMK